MNRMLLGAAALALLAGAANAQNAPGRSGAAQGPTGTNLSSGGVTLLMPRVEIVPSPAGAVGAVISSPPPGRLQDKPGVSGMSGATIRRDLNGDGPGAAGGQGGAAGGQGAAGGGRVGSSGSGGSRGQDYGGVSGSDASAGLGTGAGAIDEQRGQAQDQLRGTTGGITATEGQRPNRVTGDRLDARQGRLGTETSGSVTGTGASIGRGGGAGIGSTGGARGSSAGGSSAGGGGSSGGGSSGGSGGGGGGR